VIFRAQEPTVAEKGSQR